MKRLVFFAVFVLTSLLGYGYTVLPKFTAVTPSGHTLSFEIDTIDFGLPGGGAWVTCGEPHGNVHFGSISAYSTLSGHVIIPDSVEYNNVKYPVTAIGSYAFCRCRNITSITIPSTVVFIGQYSLNGCSGMDTINVESTEAPAIEDNSVFVGSNTYANVLIPSCSYLQSYIDEWGTTFNYICFSPIFELSINSNDSTWGMGSYNGLGDSSVVLFATSNYGYHFDHWSTGSTANPDTITLNSDTTITAFFAPNQYALHVSSADSSLGIVGGGGLYEYLDTVSISAAPVAHHHFVRWNDGNTMNPRNIIVTNDTSFTAIFAIDTHSVSLQVDSIIHGVCNGNGDYAYGTAATAVAIPYSGYQFSHWSNGSIYNPYTFAVVDDTRLTAYFRTIGEPYQGILVLHDTLIVHDTTYITREVHDTTFINHYVHDTTFINNYVHDTLIAYVNQYVHDTTYINNYIHDTSYIYRTQYDTLFVYNTVHDTAWLTAYVHDTAFVNNYIHDTVWLTQTVWEYIHDTVIQHVNHYIHDTTFINNDIHDTTYLTRYVENYIHDTVMQYVNQYFHDTTFINNYIHDTIISYVNHYIHDTTFVNNYIHDTLFINNYIYDTIVVDNYIYDTIYRYIHDTVVIHDTIYLSEEGVENVVALNIKLYQRNGQIVVEGADGYPVYLYDVVGRLLATKCETLQEVLLDVPASGAYLVKIGDAPARRIVVKR